jgi:hypothetical protein
MVQTGHRRKPRRRFGGFGVTNDSQSMAREPRKSERYETLDSSVVRKRNQPRLHAKIRGEPTHRAFPATAIRLGVAMP